MKVFLLVVPDCDKPLNMQTSILYSIVHLQKCVDWVAYFIFVSNLGRLKLTEDGRLVKIGKSPIII